MKAIWKFTIDNPHKVVFEMPVGSRVLCVQVQEGIPRIWVEIQSTERGTQQEKREFVVYGTGHVMRIDEGKTVEYIGTFQMYDGKEVYHLYELK